MGKPLSVILALSILALTCGCTPPPKTGAPAAPVKGTITLDTKPIATGELHFSIADYPPRVVPITDGAFAGEAPIGANKVELVIYVDAAASEKYKGSAGKINSAPEKYWGPNTVLEAKVPAAGANDLKFEVSSK